MTYLPRFHPLIAEIKGQLGWWIMDSCANQPLHAREPIPYTDEPCQSHEEAQELCDMLCSSEPDPREERDKR